MSSKPGGKVRRSVSVAQLKGGKIYDSLSSGHVAVEYTCFLIPRTPAYKLTEKHAKISADELKQICLSNGWNLEFVKVTAKYLQWAVSVPRSVKMMDLISRVRTGLNEQIRPLHKKMETRHPFDFWAEGYLVLHGLHPHPGEIIDQYILLVRRHQQKH